MIEAGGEGEYSVAIDRFSGRLIADNATEGGGTHDRTTCLGTDRSQAHASRHCRRRAAGGPAGRVIEIPRIARDWGIEIGIGRRDGLTQDNGTCPPQFADDISVGLGGETLRHEFRAATRREPGDINDVLNADGNAVQRTSEFAPFGFFVENLGFVQRTLLVDLHPRFDSRFPFGNVGQTPFDDVGARQLSVTNRLGSAGQSLFRCREQLHGRGLPRCLWCDVSKKRWQCTRRDG